MSGERWDVLAVIGAGGALGTALRHGLSLWVPHSSGGFPLSTLLVNVIGCAAIGGFMVVITETTLTHRLLRPFLGVGVLGGFTTFSTYVVDVAQLVVEGQPWLALAYLVGTVLAALAAVAVGVLGMRGVLRWTARRKIVTEHHKAGDQR
ncbi:MAG: fluoride efflux transporter FluC [Haloechinothrix sp.]